MIDNMSLPSHTDERIAIRKEMQKYKDATDYLSRKCDSTWFTKRTEDCHETVRYLNYSF